MKKGLATRIRSASYAGGIIYTLCLAILSAGGCDSSSRSEAEAEPVISIGSTEISAAQFKSDIHFVLAGADTAQGGAYIEKSLVEELVDYYLILEYADRKGISVSPSEVQEAAAALTGEYSEVDLKNALLEGYLREEEWKSRLENRLLIQKTVERVVQRAEQPSASEIKKYFQTHKDEFRSPRMVKFRQIVCESKEKAAELLQRLEQGENMESLALNYSTAPEAKKGGLVDWVAIKNLEESMGDALSSLAEGEISPVVKTSYGYHLFKVISVRPAGVKELPEVIHEIEERLLEENRERIYRNWLRDLRSQFEVRIDYQTIEEMEF